MSSNSANKNSKQTISYRCRGIWPVVYNVTYSVRSQDSLQTLIEDMDFADDLPSDDNTTRFKKHNRFLRSLKLDTLLIIDNFNTTAANEPQLDLLMKYGCKIIFTTRSRFEVGYTYELNEIADLESLVSLAGHFYTETLSNRQIVESIIETVHCHTLSVELAARLLQTGILEPN